MDLYSQIYFGNSIMQFLQFFGIIVASILAGKAISFIFANALTKIAKKSNNTFDDFLIAALKKPITVFAILAGMYFAFGSLTLEESARHLANRGFEIAVIIYSAWLATKATDSFIQKVLKPLAKKTDSKLDNQLLPIFSKSVKVVVWIMAGIIIIRSFGYDITAILAGLGIGGLAFAFAAQRTIADIFGGISILFSKPFVIGDTIETGRVMGKVEEIDLRNTKIRDSDGRIVTVPNSTISSEEIKNITSEPTRKITANLGLTYGTSTEKIKQAMKIITKVVNSNENCKPEPQIYFSEFRDFSVNLLVMYYVTDKENWQQIRHDVNMKIKSEFDKAKIDFAFPTQTVHVQK
ncbi:MAG: mechanosensitive ion channel family protein [Candidatus Diapherotrites archaeon]|nr:mechanosensitive ion channel family protein [Candidatus Diapherotrites archaeon]